MKSESALMVILFFFLISGVFAQPGLVNFRWVGDTGLALSGQPSPTDWETLSEMGIDATVNLAQIPDIGSNYSDNEEYLDSLGIGYYWLPVIDDIDIAWDVSEEEVDTAINWINQKLSENKKVLIHCSWGQGRAPTLGCMWYVHEGHTPEEAFSWISQYPEQYLVEIQKDAVRDYYNWIRGNPDTDFSENYMILTFVAVIVVVIIVAVFLYFKLKKWRK